MTTLRAYATNLGEYTKGRLVGEWVEFPCDTEKWEEVLKRIKIGETSEEYFFTDYESEIAGLSKELAEFENYEDLQELAEKLEDLERWERNIFEASLESESCRCAAACVTRIEMLDEWQLYEDVKSDYDLGAYYIEETGILSNIPENIRDYFDYEAFGRDVHIEEGGAYTSKGYVVRER